MNIIIDTHILLWSLADPDRMLIAQSLSRDYSLMSDDEKIHLYTCPLV